MKKLLYPWDPAGTGKSYLAVSVAVKNANGKKGRKSNFV